MTETGPGCGQQRQRWRWLWNYALAVALADYHLRVRPGRAGLTAANLGDLRG